MQSKIFINSVHFLEFSGQSPRVPPVPISNTEVKPWYVSGCTAFMWEAGKAAFSNIIKFWVIDVAVAK